MRYEERKITARIDPELYEQVQDNFHYGQQTLLFRQIFKSIKILIDENRFDEITNYMYKGKALKLPEIKES